MTTRKHPSFCTLHFHPVENRSCVSPYLLSFDIVLNSLRSPKKLTPLFSNKSKLFLQNTRGGVPPQPSFIRTRGVTLTLLFPSPYTCLYFPAEESCT
jgi:hypothetical protein